MPVFGLKIIKFELIEILSNLIEAFPTKLTFSSLKKSIVFASPLKELFSLLDLIELGLPDIDYPTPICLGKTPGLARRELPH